MAREGDEACPAGTIRSGHECISLHPDASDTSGDTTASDTGIADVLVDTQPSDTRADTDITDITDDAPGPDADPLPSDATTPPADTVADVPTEETYQLPSFSPDGDALAVRSGTKLQLWNVGRLRGSACLRFRLGFSRSAQPVRYVARCLPFRGHGIG